ncbi:Protein H01G02.3 b [Aphelenchoides avenae]|nr:Protein H01G02.3 b [Aphelenchus avenae]
MRVNVQEWSRSWHTFIRISLLRIAAITLLVLPSSDCLRCYCTDDDCVPYGVCNVASPGVCLVGLVASTNAVIRTCGEEPVGCQRGIGKWADLCGCSEPFCNTFSFLRQNTQRRDKARTSPSVDDAHGDDSLVFQRVDPPLGDFSHYDQHPDGKSPYAAIHRRVVSENAPFSTQTSLLTLLLVIVPLSVGATAIIVVAFNYYCHLC